MKLNGFSKLVLSISIIRSEFTNKTNKKRVFLLHSIILKINYYFFRLSYRLINFSVFINFISIKKT